MGLTVSQPRDVAAGGAEGEPLLSGVWFHQGRMQGSVESKGPAWYSARTPPPHQPTAYRILRRPTRWKLGLSTALQRVLMVTQSLTMAQ